jgi:prepilin-type N-terminal cleavage/methylation domain-containing protein
MYDSSLEDTPLKKSAFTMLELVFVIVVVGILAAAIIPRVDRDTLYEATEQLQTHIKYTQHLAMMDDVYDDSEQNWFYEYWKIDFPGTNHQYVISKGDADGNFFAHTTVARDPQTRVNIDGTANDEYDLNDKYSVTIAMTDGTTENGVLAFDHLGRPHYLANNINPARAVSKLLKAPLVITITDANDATNTATITVRPETGYSSTTFN